MERVCGGAGAAGGNGAGESSTWLLTTLKPSPPPHPTTLYRKGQTFYPHILCQFPSDEQATLELDITDEALAAKNEKNGGKLQRSYSGPATDVFARVLRGLSGSKLTRPGAFRDAEGSGFAVKCSYKVGRGLGMRHRGCSGKRLCMGLLVCTVRRRRSAMTKRALVRADLRAHTHPPHPMLHAGGRRIPVPAGARLLLRPETAPAPRLRRRGRRRVPAPRPGWAGCGVAPHAADGACSLSLRRVVCWAPPSTPREIRKALCKTYPCGHDSACARTQASPAPHFIQTQA